MLTVNLSVSWGGQVAKVRPPWAVCCLKKDTGGHTFLPSSTAASLAGSVLHRSPRTFRVECRPSFKPRALELSHLSSSRSKLSRTGPALNFVVASKYQVRVRLAAV